MAIPANACIFDPGVEGGVRRPDVADVGAVALLNDPRTPPPTTGTHMHADMGNQWQRLMRAFGSVIPSCRLTIIFVSGVPEIQNVMPLGATVDADTFTIIDSGTGLTSIQWAAADLPAPVCNPSGLTLHGVGTHSGGAILTLNGGGAGIHDISVCTTVSATGAAANVPFTIDIN
jgi:hypothetical protein